MVYKPYLSFDGSMNYIAFVRSCILCENFEHVQGIVKVNETYSEIVLDPNKVYSLFMIQQDFVYDSIEKLTVKSSDLSKHARIKITTPNLRFQIEGSLTKDAVTLVFRNIILDVNFTIEPKDLGQFFVDSINSEFDDKYSLIHISKRVDFSLINC